MGKNKPIPFNRKGKVRSIYPISLAIAASIILLLSIYIVVDRSQRTTEIIGEQLIDDETKIKELMEAEVYYTSQIDNKKEEIFTYAGENDDFIKDIDLDLLELDQVFRELKQDILDNGKNEEVIEAMIQNYRLKLQILDEVLVQLQKSKNKNDENKVQHEIY